jgi:hypothetical protein
VIVDYHCIAAELTRLCTQFRVRLLQTHPTPKENIVMQMSLDLAQHFIFPDGLAVRFKNDYIAILGP